MSDCPSHENSSSTPAPSTEPTFTEKQKLLSQQLLDALAQVKNAYEQIAKKQKLWQRISSDIDGAFSTSTVYSETLTRFMTATRLPAIPTQVEEISNGFDQVKENLGKARTEIDEYIQKTKEHMDTIQTKLQAVNRAQSEAELASISIPSVDWLKDLPEPSAEQVDAEWSRMGLQENLNALLAQLQNMLKPKPEKK